MKYRMALLMAGVTLYGSLIVAAVCLVPLDRMPTLSYVGSSPIEFVSGEDRCLGTGRVTYRNTIQPILARHCDRCHSQDAASYEPTFGRAWSHLPQEDFSTWETVRANLGRICQAVGYRRMPVHTEAPLSDAEYARFQNWCGQAGFNESFFSPPPGEDGIDTEALIALTQTSEATCMNCHANSAADKESRQTCASVLFDEEDEWEQACRYVAAGEMPLLATHRAHVNVATSFGCTPANHPLEPAIIQAFGEACGDDYRVGKSGEALDPDLLASLHGYPSPVLSIEVVESIDGSFSVNLYASFGQSLRVAAVASHHPTRYSIALFYDDDHQDFDGTRLRRDCLNANYEEVSRACGYSIAISLSDFPEVDGQSFLYVYACISDDDNVYCVYDEDPIRTDSFFRAKGRRDQSRRTRTARNAGCPEPTL